MKKLHSFAAVAALALISTASFAGEATEFTRTPSSATRASVQPDVKSAAVRDTLEERNENYGYIDPTELNSQRSRADVKAEVAQARAQGTLQGRNEAYGYVRADGVMGGRG